MNNWKEFVFNEPYVGGKIERINNVILPKQYRKLQVQVGHLHGRT